MKPEVFCLRRSPGRVRWWNARALGALPLLAGLACAESNGPATRLFLRPDTLTVAAHSHFGLEPVFVGGRASPLIWSSSEDAVAAVDSSGTVRGRWPGTATIRAQTPGSSGLFASSRVTVVGPALRLVPDSVDVAAGFGYARLFVQHSPPGGAGPALLRSSDTTIAVVDSTGLACPVRPGRAYVRARSSGLEDSALVRVRNLPPPPIPSGMIQVLDSTGGPASPVAGTVTVKVIWFRWLCDRPDTLDVQLRVDSALVANRRRHWVGTDSIAFPLDTRATDASGRPLVPDGSRELRVLFLADGKVAMVFGTTVLVSNRSP